MLNGVYNAFMELLAPLVPESPRPKPKKALPIVPAVAPAAVEPVWNRHKLSLPKKAAKTDLTKPAFSAALRALRKNLTDLADDLKDAGNIDSRYMAYLRASPTRPEEIAHAGSTFRVWTFGRCHFVLHQGCGRSMAGTAGITPSGPKLTIRPHYAAIGDLASVQAQQF
jgi:hypothetical protein